MPVTGVSHVGVSTPDLARSLAFYRDALGFADVAAFSWPQGTDGADAGLGLSGTAADVAIVTAGNVYLEILQFHSPAPRAYEPADALHREGITHIGLEVTDVDAVRDLVLASGGSDYLPAARTPGVHLVRDPDGFVLELRSSAPLDPLSWSRLRVAVPAADGAAPPARPGPRRDLVHGVGHLGIATADAEGLSEFYLAAGLTLGADYRWGTGRCITLAAGNAALELLEYHDDLGVVPRAGGAQIIDHGFNHVCFDVTDIGTLHERLVGRGMTFHAPWVTMPAGNAAMGYALDPQTTPIELLEHLTTSSVMWPGHLTTDLAG